MKTKNKYLVEIKKGIWVDVYDVLRGFEVTDPAIQHAVKKLLADGTGDKDRHTNIEEAKQSIERYLEVVQRPARTTQRKPVTYYQDSLKDDYSL